MSEEWVEQYDTDSNRAYYYNSVTGESSWDKPAELIGTAAELTTDQFNYSDSYAADSYQTNGTVPNKWKEHYDVGSNLYYYENIETGETQWDRPADYYATEEAVEETKYSSVEGTNSKNTF